MTVTILVLLVVLVVLLTARTLQAQTEPAPPPPAPAATDDSVWKNVRFGATLEGYYHYDWNRPPDRVLALRVYDTRANVFVFSRPPSLSTPPRTSPPDAATVFAPTCSSARPRKPFRAVRPTNRGLTSTVTCGRSTGRHVFPVGAGLQADFGKFASMLGYETNYAKDNQAFSRAYLFNFLPFYHSGLRLSLPVNDKVTLLYMLTNGIQQTEDFNDFKSNHFAAIVKPLSQVVWTINYYLGQEQPDRGQPGGPDGFFRVFDTVRDCNPDGFAHARPGREPHEQRSPAVGCCAGSERHRRGTGEVQATSRSAFGLEMTSECTTRVCLAESTSYCTR